MSCKFPGLFGLLLGATTLSAYAQGNTNIAATPTAAYGQDNQGSVARSQYGLCWRTGYWTPSDSLTGCDGELAPLITNPIAPALVSNPAAITVNAAVSANGTNCDFSITLNESQTFGSGKTTLNKAAQQRIQAQVVEKLPTCGIDAIVVTGHADRLGSRKHNEEIALKRAEAVAAFLKSKSVAAPIQIVGAGSNEPVAQCGQNLPARKLTACLSPDRRVVIHVQGHEK